MHVVCMQRMFSLMTYKHVYSLQCVTVLSTLSILVNVKKTQKYFLSYFAQFYFTSFQGISIYGVLREQTVVQY